MGLEKIEEYKRKLGMTTSELAEKSGVPKGTLDKILSGVTKDPKLETLKSIAHVLGLSLDDFDDFNKENDNIHTLAAHFDGEDYTDEEIKEIIRFADFVKNKRK